MSAQAEIRTELMAKIDWMISAISESSQRPEDTGWSVDLAARYIGGLEAFRERIRAGTTSEQDKTMSWTRAFDFEGLAEGAPALVAIQVDKLRREYFSK